VVNCNYFRRLTEANKNRIIEKLNFSLYPVDMQRKKKIAEANKNKNKEFNQLTLLTSSRMAAAVSAVTRQQSNPSKQV